MRTDTEPRWMDRHSVNCYRCGAIADERECVPNSFEFGGTGEGGELCAGCVRTAPESVAGKFLTFEGIDGAGKSTYIPSLAAWIKAQGIEVVVTREPGGSALAEKLRAMALHDPMDALTEALLMFAARRDHLRTVIEPALRRGATVLCDRFTDSTHAYQGGGRGFDARVLNELERWVQEGRQPDLTLLYDLAPTEAVKRRAARAADRFEKEEVAFFERVRDAYLLRVETDPARFAVLDASLPVSNVWNALTTVICERFGVPVEP